MDQVDNKNSNYKKPTSNYKKNNKSDNNHKKTNIKSNKNNIKYHKNNKNDVKKQSIKQDKSKIKNNKLKKTNININKKRLMNKNEFIPIKKSKNKKIKLLLLCLTLIFLFIITTIILINNLDVKEDLPKKEIEIINYKDYYHDKVKVMNDKKIYELIDNKFVECGMVFKDITLNLIEDEYLEKGYFKIKDLDYYIDYKDISLDETIETIKKETYRNYIPFNESIKTNKETNLYLDDKIIYSLNKEIELPILIKENDYYGVIYNEKLFYIKKNECEVIKANNTSLEKATGIATLVYHFTYDSTNKEEERNCKNSNITICLSDTLFKQHLTYIKDNNFYTATMEDLELFIDGKVNLPKKTVVITIDDGYYLSAAIKVLEEVDVHATLFLIGVAGSPDKYKSDNLEIHSHTYALHYPYACKGGQGSPLKCLNRDVLLEDLRKSREQLNGSTVFCYPFFEYNDYAIGVLKEAGFTMAFAGTRTKIKVGSNKYKLPRYGIINTTTVSDIARIIN